MIDAPPPIDVQLDPIDAPAGSVVVRFGETPTATFKGVTQDTYISNDTALIGTYNYGASTRLMVETTQKRALIRFDVSSLPASAQLISARLHINVATLESTSTIMVLPVLETWTQGTQDGTAGVANYTKRTSSQNWTTAGAGAGSTGAALVSAPISSLGEAGIDLPIATIKSWRDTPATNFGLAFSASGGDLTISASNDTPDSGRPELVVTYFP